MNGGKLKLVVKLGGFGGLRNCFEAKIRQICENQKNRQKLPTESTEKLIGQYRFAHPMILFWRRKTDEIQT